MFDLNDVAMFVQVVRHGSFAEAARRLGLPPNTVSRRIQQLESQLGTRLMQRSTRKLTLTSAGQDFHDRCAGLVDGLAAAGQALVAGGQEPSGLVRVAAPADFFDFFPMEWVSDFLAAHPLVKLDFVLSDAAADLIAEQIDVAFRGGVLRDSGYIGRRLATRSGGLLASPAYIAQRGEPATLQELADHDCVTPPHPSGHTIWRLTGPEGWKKKCRSPAGSPATPPRHCARRRWPGWALRSCRRRWRRATNRKGGWCGCCRSTSTPAGAQRGLPEPQAPAAGGVGLHRPGAEQARPHGHAAGAAVFREGSGPFRFH